MSYVLQLAAQDLGRNKSFLFGTDGNNVKCKCVSHKWKVKDGLPGMVKAVSTLEVNGTLFSVDGMVMHDNVMRTHYDLVESKARRYALFLYDWKVLWAVSSLGAKTFWQVESELLKRGNIPVRTELYKSFERLAGAGLCRGMTLPTFSKLNASLNAAEVRLSR